jgi:uncharacterized protein
LLVDKKFITIFSVLFGFGFYVIMERAKQKGIELRTYFIKRMLILLLVGSVHAYAFWFGDIIRDYALCGMFLLLVYHWSTRKLLITALVFSVFLTGTVFILNSALELQRYRYDTSIVQELPLTISYWRYLQINSTIDPFVNFVQDSPITLLFCFGNIVLGFVLGKTGFFHQPSRHKKLRRNLILGGASLGVGCSYLFWLINKGELELSTSLIWMPYAIVAGMLLQSLGYISAVISLFQVESGKKVLSWFEPVGKMALTNYLLQTFFYIILFFGWSGGPHLYGKLTQTETYLVSILLFFVQVAFSHWWMKKHEQGPVERMWKNFSYRFANVKSRPSVPEAPSVQV